MWDVCVEGADIERQGLILMAAFPGLTASSTVSIVSLGMMGFVPRGGAGGCQHTRRFVWLGLHMRT